MKGGIAIMALETMACNPGLEVTVVPVGLNYFQGHKFRSRVFVDIGEPFVPSKQMVAQYNLVSLSLLQNETRGERERERGARRTHAHYPPHPLSPPRQLNPHPLSLTDQPNRSRCRVARSGARCARRCCSSFGSASRRSLWKPLTTILSNSSAPSAVSIRG